MNNKYVNYLKIGIIAIGMGMVSGSCSDDVSDDSYYTFTGDTVSSYCSTLPGYSTFARLINETGVSSLLSTYGHYTCFLPDDDAFATYFHEIGKSYDDLTMDEKLEIVYNHLINSSGTDYTSEHFEEGSLPEANMNDQYVTISYSTDPSGEGLLISVNKNSHIIEKDIELHNGVVHLIDRVLTTSTDYLLNILDELDGYTIFAEAFRLTGLDRKTMGVYDESYECPYPSGRVTRDGMEFNIPTVKRLGYTFFVEPDEVMHAAGINNVEDLKAYARNFYGNEAENDYTNPDNPLYRFVAYHILDRMMPTNSFIYNGACTAPNYMSERREYYETMFTYRLMEIKAGNKINQQKSGVCVEIDENNSNHTTANGYVHTLRNMLVYDPIVMENDVLNKRIRFDFYNVPPELTNNNIRWRLTEVPQGTSGYIVTNDFCGDHLKFSDETTITMWASDGWTNFEADELKLNGWYDFTLRMLPVPPGSYEVRIGYRQESWRGIAQLFIDGEIQGIPRDLRITGTDPQVGWIADTGTPSDSENDKAMRNRGYMKAPNSIWANQLGGTLRTSPNCLRIIVGQINAQEYGAHYLRGKNVYAPSQEFHGDYIEIIPTSLIDTEDIN